MATQESAEHDPAALPLALRMRGRLAVVVGGGEIAEGAVHRLLTAGARVLVVAPWLSQGLADLADRDLVSVRTRGYEAADLDGAWLVLTCGPDDVNARAAADADVRRIWSAHGAAAEPGAALPADAGADAGAGAAALLPEPPGPVSAAGLGDAARAQVRGGRRVLVLGGARSGKSAAAESMVAGAAFVDYVATGLPAGRGDAEWDQRVREHQARRPAGWSTLETTDVAEVLTSADSARPVLIDCLATWLAQVMDDCGLWSSALRSSAPRSGAPRSGAPRSGATGADARLAEQTDRLVAAWQQTGRHAVAVSNEVGCGVVPATASGRRFRDELGWLNSRIAGASDEVWFCTAGIPRRLR